MKDYSKGYNAGRRGKWPDHRPPTPPDEILGPLIAAANSLRDEADAVYAALGGEDDAFLKDLNDAIENYNAQCERMTNWLLRD